MGRPGGTQLEGRCRDRLSRTCCKVIYSRLNRSSGQLLILSTGIRIKCKVKRNFITETLRERATLKRAAATANR